MDVMSGLVSFAEQKIQEENQPKVMAYEQRLVSGIPGAAKLKNDETITDNNITLEEIHYALKAVYGENISCFYNDLNDEEIIFRIRLINLKAKIMQEDS
jgi:hypothetical protein